MRILAFDGAGTKGRGQGSVLAHCVDHLGEKLNAPVVFVPTESSLMGVGGNTPWPAATDDAIRWATDYMWTHPGQYILVGYSARRNNSPPRRESPVTPTGDSAFNGKEAAWFREYQARVAREAKTAGAGRA